MSSTTTSTSSGKRTGGSGVRGGGGVSDNITTISVENQPGKDRIPPGTKRIVIFDTNAYREFAPGGSLANCHEKAIRLRECDQANSVFVLASPTVIWELTAHLADRTDKAYNQCLKSLVMLGEHPVNPAKPDGGISLFPDAESTVCRELFHAVPEVNERGVRNLGSFVRHIVKYAPDLSDPKAQAHINQIAAQVDAAEKGWLKSMQPVLARCDPAAVKHLFGNVSDVVLRKQMSNFFTTQPFVDMWATFTVQMHAAKVGYKIVSDDDLKKKARIALDAFPVPVHLMSSLLQKIAMDQNFKLHNPDRKRWNFIWDTQLTFSIGNSHKIGDAPIFFVTGDAEVIAAAKAAKCDSRVLSLKDYLASVGF